MSATDMNIDGTALDRKHRYNRRRFLGIGAVAVAGAGTLAFVAGRGTAHDATPKASGTPEASPSASPAASPVASATEVTVHTVDLAFEPRDLTIPANTDVTVRVENLGVILHDFTIDQLGVTSGTTSSRPRSSGSRRLARASSTGPAGHGCCGTCATPAGQSSSSTARPTQWPT